MTLTKQDIDALVDGLEGPVVRAQPAPGNCFSLFAPMIGVYRPDDLRRALYLAAGLTAEGERKPERVRCWIYSDSSGKCLTMVEPGCGESRWKFTPGWFVPDGTE